MVLSLLRIKAQDGLLGHPVAGGSWEGWVIENLLSVAPSGTQPFFYRGSAPALGRGFHLAATDVQAHRRLVVHGGEHGFPLAGGIEAMSLVQALSELSRA